MFLTSFIWQKYNAKQNTKYLKKTHFEYNLKNDLICSNYVLLNAGKPNLTITVEWNPNHMCISVLLRP